MVEFIQSAGIGWVPKPMKLPAGFLFKEIKVPLLETVCQPEPMVLLMVKVELGVSTQMSIPSK